MIVLNVNNKDSRSTSVDAALVFFLLTYNTLKQNFQHNLLVFFNLQRFVSRPDFDCSKSTMETPEQCVKSVQN